MRRVPGILETIISGGQSGVDLAALEIAQKLEFKTGGWMPFGFMTEDGSHPEYGDRFNLKAHSSINPVDRTKANVRTSDATFRIALNFNSPGEKVSLNALTRYKKPYMDIQMTGRPIVQGVIDQSVAFILVNRVKVLNISGNRESIAPGIYQWACATLESILLAYNQRHQ